MNDRLVVVGKMPIRDDCCCVCIGKVRCMVGAVVTKTSGRDEVLIEVLFSSLSFLGDGLTIVVVAFVRLIGGGIEDVEHSDVSFLIVPVSFGRRCTRFIVGF
jgi:hypothetical protein